MFLRWPRFCQKTSERQLVGSPEAPRLSCLARRGRRFAIGCELEDDDSAKILKQRGATPSWIRDRKNTGWILTLSYRFGSSEAS